MERKIHYKPNPWNINNYPFTLNNNDERNKKNPAYGAPFQEKTNQKLQNDKL